jgi:hypothetical protein
MRRPVVYHSQTKPRCRRRSATVFTAQAELVVTPVLPESREESPQAPGLRRRAIVG